MKVLVAGASGYIGTELVTHLEAAGHEVTTLTRGDTHGTAHHWNPTERELDQALIESADAVINLAGASISKIPWSKAYQREILKSRLDATGTIVDAVNAATSKPSVLLNGSAVGFYGDRPVEPLTEEAGQGNGFLADVVERWEAEALRATTRVVTFRTGLVVGRGGAFGPLGLLTRFGLAARIGSGAQHWPWIALTDEARAIVHLLTSELSGPVNLQGPVPATSVEITRLLAQAMHRPHLLALPEFVVRATLGTAGQELLLSDQQGVPGKLLADGFEFEFERVSTAIDATWSA